MNRRNERHENIKRIFSVACDLPEFDRASYLRSECGSDLSLIQEVESLLQFDNAQKSDDVTDLLSAAHLVEPVHFKTQSRLSKRRAIATVVVIAALVVFVFFANSWIRQHFQNHVKRDVTTIARIYANAVEAWQHSRIYEAQQWAQDSRIRELTEKLVDADRSEAESVGLVKEFYEVTEPYTTSHHGAALHIASRDGIVLADTDPRWLGKSLNADAFEYLVPVFTGETAATPIIQNGGFTVDPPAGELGSRLLSYIVAPVFNDKNEVIAALAGMEFEPFGFFAIIGGLHNNSDIEIHIFDAKGNTFNPNRSAVTRERRTKILTDALPLRTNGGPSHGAIVQPYLNLNSNRVVGAWQWMPEQNTGIIVEKNAKSAYWGLYLCQVLLATCGVMVVGILLQPFTPLLIRKTRNAHLDDRYQITGLLGKGGLARVYRATDMLLNRSVAIKILKQHEGRQTSLSRFKREVDLIGQLRHPCTVQIFGCGIDEKNSPYYVMELVEGVTFEQLLQSKGMLSESSVIRLAMQVCQPLAEAHSKGIIHRDIKPQNLMVCDFETPRQFVKVLDFGLGKNVFVKDKPITSKTEIPGTISFMAPECISDSENPGPYSDVYSLGVLIHFLMTGLLVFESNSTLKIIHSILNDPPTFAPTFKSHASDQLQRLTARCLEKSPNKRPQDAESLYRELQRIETSLIGFDSAN